MALTCPSNQIPTDFGCLPNTPGGFVEKFYGWGLGFIGLVGLIYLIIGGYHIMLSRGDPQRLQTGKSYIIYAIIGILLAVFGFVFFQVVTHDLLKLPGFN